jgi:hypothetical protein
MLMEHETMKLKEQEEAYSRELKEWKGQLKPRKQVSCWLLVQFILGSSGSWHVVSCLEPD